MQLYIGNKNYSSWSLRPWLLMKQAGIPFEEKKVRSAGRTTRRSRRPCSRSRPRAGCRC
jgi:glutathione S-transferase